MRSYPTVSWQNLRLLPKGKPVKKINSLTEDQKDILRSLKCEHLATRKYVKDLVKS